MTTLVKAGFTHAHVLAVLQQGCFPDDHWSADFILSLLEHPGTFAVLALDGEDPVGFVLARAAGGDGEILAIGVANAVRRRGIGRLLVHAAVAGTTERGATAVFLEVAEDNDGARALYSAAGFVPVGRRPGYYRRGAGRVAALVLRFPYTFPSP